MASRRLIDIGANLTDKMFSGIYKSIHDHPNDFEHVLDRAKNNGLEKIIITGGSLVDSEEAIALSKTRSSLFCTVGCHPTRCLEFDKNADDYYEKLKDLIVKNPLKVVAVGECGLDYDREEFCSKDIQQKYFDLQLKLAGQVNLPLFLHCRAAHEDLLSIIEKSKSKYFVTHTLKGVIHTFDGTLEMANRCLQMEFYIGINGCSLKTENNLEKSMEE